MRSLRTQTFFAVLCLLLAGSAAAQLGPGPFAAFPTADVTDGRMLSFGCGGIETFEQQVSITIAVPVDQSELTVSFFDGDTGKPDVANPALGHWDVGARQLVFSLYNDPERSGNTAPGDQVASWTGNDPNPLSGPGWTASAAEMPDNDWWGATVSVSPAALSPAGDFYFYNLVIDTDGVCTSGEVLASDLKIATSNPMAFLVPRFGFEASLRQFANDGPIIYPGTFPPPGFDFVNAPTTFDGTFEFTLVVTEGSLDLALFDGDFDHGTNPSQLTGLPSGLPLPACSDTDDPDTTPGYDGFPFDASGANPEGVSPFGAPPDDTAFDVFRRGEPGDPARAGCVRYEVIDPDGNVYSNANPSGNLEWEQYRIVSQLSPDANDPTKADVTAATPTLPAGLWTVRIYGLDMSNLNFWFADTCSVRDGEAACPPPVPPCPFRYAIQATEGSITVGRGAVVDRYSSCRCPYSAVFDDGGDLRAGGGIEVHPDAQVAGVQLANLPGDPTPQPVPGGLVSGGDLTVLTNQTVTLPAGDYLFDDIHVISNGHLVITGGSARIWFNGQLRVDSNGSIEAEDAKPTSLTLYSTATSSDVLVGSNGLVIGGVFAPNVPVFVGSNGAVYGSVVGSSVQLASDADVHLDDALCEDCPAVPPAADPVPPVVNAVESTAGDVVIGSDAFIEGDVQAAGTVVNNGAFVGGSQLSGVVSDSYSQPIPPGLTSSGDLFIGSNQTMVLPAGDYLFEDVFLGSNALLRGQGGLVRVWFTGSLEIGSNASVIGAKGCAGNFWFFGQCGPGTVLVNEHSSDFNLVGAIYAPDLPITVYSNSRIRGGLVGASFDIRSNARISYDFALVDGCEPPGS